MVKRISHFIIILKVTKNVDTKSKSKTKTKVITTTHQKKKLMSS